MSDQSDQEPETNSRESLKLSTRQIAISAIVVLVCITLELIWSSQKIPELRETSIYRSERVFYQFNGIQVTALAIASGLLVAVISFLGNWIARLKNKFVRVLIGIGAILAASIAQSLIAPFFYGYYSPDFVVRAAGAWLVCNALHAFIGADSSRKPAATTPSKKPVGWSQPPENDWWSKYN